MQERKEHTEMDILSLPTAKNQEELLKFLLSHEAQWFGSRMAGCGAGRMLVWRVEEELVTSKYGYITMATSRAVAMTPH